MAITLGAVERQRAVEQAVSPVASHHALPNVAWLRRAYEWGVHHGLPREPGLAVYLVAAPQGDRMLLRCQRAQQCGRHLMLPAELLRALLQDGTPPPQVVALLEAAMAMEPLAQELLRLPQEVPVHYERKRNPRKRRVAMTQLHQSRADLVNALAATVRDYAELAADPDTLRLVAGLLRAMLELARALQSQVPDEPVQQESLPHRVSGLGSQVMGLLRRVILVADLAKSYLQILVEQAKAVWDFARMPVLALSPSSVPLLGTWLGEVEAVYVRPLESLSCIARLLRRCRSERMVREALKLGIARGLSHCTWRDAHV